MADRSAQAPAIGNEDEPVISGVRHRERPNERAQSDPQKKKPPPRRPAVRTHFGNLPARVVPLFERLTRLQLPLLADMLDELRSELAARREGPDIRTIRRLCAILEALAPSHVAVPVRVIRSAVSWRASTLDEALLGAHALGRLVLRPAGSDVDPADPEACVIGPSGSFGAVASAPARTQRRLLAEAREVCIAVGRLLACDDVLRAAIRRLERFELAVKEQPTLEDAAVLGAIFEGQQHKGLLPGVPLPLLRALLSHAPRVWVDRRLLSLWQSEHVELFPMKKGAPFADPYAVLFDGMGELYYARLTNAGHAAAARVPPHRSPPRSR